MIQSSSTCLTLLSNLFSKGDWKWSNGESLTARPDFQKIVNNSAPQISSDEGEVYCFVVTNDAKLQMENCTVKHRYICGQYTGNKKVN